MNKLSTRQLCFFMACMVPVGKLINLPELLAAQSGGDLLLSALMSYALQAIVIGLLLWLSQRTQCTFFELIENTFGKTFARVVYFFLALYFLFYSLVPLLEQKSFVQSAFYDTIPAIIVFLPFFLFSSFACVKNMTAIGRVADLSLILFALSFFGLMFMSISSGDFSSLLPFGEQPFVSSLKGSLHTLNWFSDSAFLLMFLGRFKGSRKSTAAILLSYLLGALFVLFFLAVFYGIFQSVAPDMKFAITRIALYNRALTTLGRIDYIFSYIMVVVLLFYAVLPLQMSVEALTYIFGERRLLYSILVNIVILASVVLFNHSAAVVYNVVEEKLFFLFLLFADLLPIIALFLRRTHEKK